MDLVKVFVLVYAILNGDGSITLNQHPEAFSTHQGCHEFALEYFTELQEESEDPTSFAVVGRCSPVQERGTSA